MNTRQNIGLSAKKAMKGCAFLTLAAWCLTLLALVIDSQALLTTAYTIASFIPIFLMLALIAKRYSNGKDPNAKYIKITLIAGMAYIALSIIVSLL